MKGLEVDLGAVTERDSQGEAAILILGWITRIGGDTCGRLFDPGRFLFVDSGLAVDCGSPVSRVLGRARYASLL